MIHSSHRDRRIKAIAEVLAMIADAERVPCEPRFVRETDEALREQSVTEFSAALEKYSTERRIKLPKHTT